MSGVCIKGLEERRKTVRHIELGKLTEDLKQRIPACFVRNELEDSSSVQTKAVRPRNNR
jgi:hypothetical protein